MEARQQASIIRRCEPEDMPAMYAIINEASGAYKGVIPADRWHEPYMPMDELEHEVADGVVFWGYEEGGELLAVMGLQHVQDVGLIRHAYVRTARQGQGLGSRLLAHLRVQTTRPLLVGTWADAYWAIGFYRKHNFQQVSREEKECLLRRYWSIPERQVETSVVLADERWLASQA